MKKLRQEWFLLFIAIIAFFVGFFVFLDRFWEPVYALRWLGLASVFGIWQFVFLWKRNTEESK